MANLFDQFDERPATGNRFDQFDAPKDVPGQISLPGIGAPSLIGMLKGLYETGKSAATLPGDVYAGRVDPMSDEGIKRATDFASVVVPGGRAAVTRRAGSTPMETPQIRSAAGRMYDEVTEASRATPLAAPPPPKDLMAPMTGVTRKMEEGISGRDVARQVRQIADEPNMPRPRAAPEAWKQIDELEKARDVGDLIDIRRNLVELTRGGGQDVAAAAAALNRLDPQIDFFLPGTTAKLRAADKSYAKAHQVADIETTVKAIGDTQMPSVSEATRLQRAFRPLLDKGRDKYMSPEARSAVKAVAKPGMGVGMLRTLGAFDPRGIWGATALGAASVPTMGKAMLLAPAAMAARGARERIMANRAQRAIEALRADAPVNMMQPGYRPPSMVALPPRVESPLPYLLAPNLND